MGLADVPLAVHRDSLTLDSVAVTGNLRDLKLHSSKHDSSFETRVLLK
jgi:hypothetical protein